MCTLLNTHTRWRASNVCTRHCGAFACRITCHIYFIKFSLVFRRCSFQRIQTATVLLKHTDDIGISVYDMVTILPSTTLNDWKLFGYYLGDFSTTYGIKCTICHISKVEWTFVSSFYRVLYRQDYFSEPDVYTIISAYNGVIFFFLFYSSHYTLYRAIYDRSHRSVMMVVLLVSSTISNARYDTADDIASRNSIRRYSIYARISYVYTLFSASSAPHRRIIWSSLSSRCTCDVNACFFFSLHIRRRICINARIEEVV